MEQIEIRPPICVSCLNKTEDVKELLLQYSKHLNLDYQKYQDLYLITRVSGSNSQLPLGEEVSKHDYLKNTYKLNCESLRKYLKAIEYCYICNAGANCNKYKKEEEFVVAYLLQSIKEGSMEIWHQLNGIITKNTFVSRYEYKEGPPFDLLGFLIELILFNMALNSIKPDCFLNAKENFFNKLPAYVKKELQTQLNDLNKKNLLEKTFEEYIEKNDILSKLIKNGEKAHKKIESIKKNNLNSCNNTLKYNRNKVNHDKQPKKKLPKEFLEDTCQLKGTTKEDPVSSSIKNLSIEVEIKDDTSSFDEKLSKEKEHMKNTQEIKKQAECKDVNSKQSTHVTNDNNSKGYKKKAGVTSEKNKNLSIEKTEKTDKVSEIKDNNKLVYKSGQNNYTDYFITDTTNIKPLDCLKITDFNQFVHTYFAQRLGIARKAVRLEFIPETKELFSYSKDTDEPVVYTFEDTEFRTLFGMQIIEGRGCYLITFNSIPLINYFDNRGHYFHRREFFDFQLGYTMVNFPQDRNKIITLEDIGILDKNNSFKDYRSKVFACIKNYHDLYDKFMEYWDMRELQFRKKYRDEIGLRYLVGRSSELEISAGRGKERVVRNARGFNYDWLLNPEELKNRDDILPNKMLLVGTFKNLKEYVEHFITEDTIATPLGYSVKVSDKYTLDELKEDVCKEVVRAVLIRIMRSWKNERSSLRLLYFDHEKIILMADNSISGRGLAFDVLYYGMGHVPKELLPGIVPKNDILEINC